MCDPRPVDFIVVQRRDGVLAVDYVYEGHDLCRKTIHGNKIVSLPLQLQYGGAQLLDAIVEIEDSGADHAAER